MIQIELAQMYGWINAFLWPLCRIAGLIMTAPILGDSAIPTRFKAAMAVTLAIIVAPLAGEMPALAPDSWAGLWIAFQQTLIGIAMGLVMRIVFAAVQTAGEFIGLQMGLSFASFFDPASGANTTVLSRFMNNITLLLLLAVNGHLLMLVGLVQSFTLLPVESQSLHTDGWGILLEWSAQIVSAGMLLALPMIIILLTISIALGILNRTAQQLSVFAVGFPMSLIAGLVLLGIILPQSMPFVLTLFEQAYDTMARMLIALSQS